MKNSTTPLAGQYGQAKPFDIKIAVSHGIKFPETEPVQLDIAAIQPELVINMEVIKNSNEHSPNNDEKKCINLYYLIHCTKSKPAVMIEFISIYLIQTPFLIGIMKGSLVHKDWSSMNSAVHSLIPSFNMMGINIEFENIAKKIQKYSGTQKQVDEIPELVLQIEKICTQACKELEDELIEIKKLHAA